MSGDSTKVRETITFADIYEETNSVLSVVHYVFGNFEESHCFVPRRYSFRDSDGSSREFDLTTLQRIFVFLTIPSSSAVSHIYSIVMVLTIFCSIINLLLGSEPANRYSPSNCFHPVCTNSSLCPDSIICTPIPKLDYQIVDLACIIFFSADFVLRFIFSGCIPTTLSGLHLKKKGNSEVQLSWYYQMFRYLVSLQSAIDILTCIPVLLDPFYTDKMSSNTLHAVRVLLVFRVLKIIRHIDGLVSIFVMTILGVCDPYYSYP